MPKPPSQRWHRSALDDSSWGSMGPSVADRRAASWGLAALALALVLAPSCAEAPPESAPAAPPPAAPEIGATTGGVVGQIFWGGDGGDVIEAGPVDCMTAPPPGPGEGLEGVVVWIEMDGAPPSWWEQGALQVSDCGLLTPTQIVRSDTPVVLESAGLSAPLTFQVDGRSFTLEPDSSVSIDGLAPGPTPLEGELSGALVLAQHGGYTLTDISGAFELPEIPPGRHQIHFWHLAAGQMDFSLTVEPGRRSQIELHWP